VPEPANVFLASRFLLRYVLARRLGCAPLAIELASGEHGKPYMRSPQSAWHFNLSHSRDMMVFALAENVELGVDVEACAHRKGLVELAERVFTPSEMERFKNLSEVAQVDYFTRAWVLKESYVKLLGKGVWQGLTELETDTNRPCFPGASSTQVTYLDVPDDFRAAVAFNTQGPIEIRQRHLRSLRELLNDEA
jgi:4'-phosphopantetheinyl transferase